MSEVAKFSTAELRQLVSDTSVESWGYRLNTSSPLAGDFSRHLSYILNSISDSVASGTVNVLGESLTDFVVSRGVSREKARELAFDVLFAVVRKQ